MFMGDYRHFSQPGVHPHLAMKPNPPPHNELQHIPAHPDRIGIGPVGEGVAGDGFLQEGAIWTHGVDLG